LHNLEQTGFHFSSKEAYLVLLVYRANTKEKVDVVSFPHSLWGLVESADNLTPRGLSSSLSSDDDGSTTHILDSFLLSKRENKEYNRNRDYKYMMFVWNGKEASALLKACALSRGFELDTLLNKSGDSLLSFIFNGGVVRGTRLQRGKVLIFDQASSEQENEENADNPNTPDTETVIKTFETVYLFQFMVPETYVQNLKSKSNISQSSNVKSVIEQTMYPKFRKYFFPSPDESMQIANRQDEISEYQKRFKFIDNQNSVDEENALSEEGNMFEERPPPQSNPIPKISLPKDFGQKLAQKPAIPLLNVPAHDHNEKERFRESLELKSEQNKVPGIKGIALDIGLISKKQQYDEYDMSSDRIYEDSGEYSSSRASNNPSVFHKGISLDLTKAKEIQNEILNQGSTGSKPMPPLGLPGVLPGVQSIERKDPTLAIPVSSGSRSGEGESSNRMEFEQSTGPQLKINIKNVAKLKEDVEMKQKEDSYEPPKHKRGSAQPDLPLARGSDNSQPEQNFNMKQTSVAEERNSKWKQICSEILEGFLYLGSDFLAKSKEKLTECGITHVINTAGDYSPNYHDGNFKYLTFHLKDHPRENIE
jgi:hypothetical protein